MTIQNQVLNQTARKDIATLIEQKGQNVLKALTEEISVDTDVIMEAMLAQMGHPKNDEALRAEKDALEYKLRHVEFDDNDELTKLSEQSDAIEAEVESQVEQLKRAQRQELDRLREQQTMAITALRETAKTASAELTAHIEAIKRQVIEGEYPGLPTRLEEIKTEAPIVAKLERQLQPEIDKKAEAIAKSRSRLAFLVRDAVASAKAALLSCDTPEEALKLIDRIPSVAEVIHIADDPQGGLAKLVERFAPSHTLSIAAPKISITQMDDAGKPLKMMMEDGQELDVEFVYDSDSAVIEG